MEILVTISLPSARAASSRADPILYDLLRFTPRVPGFADLQQPGSSRQSPWDLFPRQTRGVIGSSDLECRRRGFHSSLIERGDFLGLRISCSTAMLKPRRFVLAAGVSFGELSKKISGNARVGSRVEKSTRATVDRVRRQERLIVFGGKDDLLAPGGNMKRGLLVQLK
jgi:hypothetical protein